MYIILIRCQRSCTTWQGIPRITILQKRLAYAVAIPGIPGSLVHRLIARNAVVLTGTVRSGKTQAPLKRNSRPGARTPDRRKEVTMITHRNPPVILPQDKGCSLANSCLNCSIPYCPHDKEAKAARNNEIKRLWLEGKSVIELANHYRLSVPSIYSVVNHASK